MAPPFKMPLAKKSSNVPKSRGRARGRGSVSNPRSRCVAGAQNPLDRIVEALPISEVQQEHLTVEEEENGERRQSDNSNAALDDSTMKVIVLSTVLFLL